MNDLTDPILLPGWPHHPSFCKAVQLFIEGRQSEVVGSGSGDTPATS